MSPWVALTALGVYDEDVNLQKVGCTLNEDCIPPHCVLNQILPVVCPGRDTMQALEVFPESGNPWILTAGHHKVPH